MSESSSGLAAILLGDKGQLIIAGLLGGLIRWMTLRQGYKDGFVSVVSGGICSYYLGPFGTWVFRPFIEDPSRQQTVSGFLVGIIGVGVTGLVLDVWRRRKRYLLGEIDHDDGNDSNEKGNT